MRALPLLAAPLFCLGALLAVTALPADAATKHKARHRPVVCNDKLMCRKIDTLSVKIDKNFASLTDTVKAGQVEDAAYHTKQISYSEQMLSSIKNIEAQGGQSHSAILLSFSDRKLAEGETAGAVANQTCVDAGFKEGKPVDVSAKHGWSSSGTYLKSVVCTF